MSADDESDSPGEGNRRLAAALPDRVPRYQWPAVVLALLAVAAIWGPGLAFGPHAGETAYHHEVRPPTADTTCEPRLDYADLSPRAQAVFDEALADGSAIVYGDGVEDFRYPGWERRFVRHDVDYRGECVHLYTRTEQHWGEGLAVLFGYAFGIVGLVSAGLAALLRRPRVTIVGFTLIPMLPLAFVLGTAVLAVPLVLGVGLWFGFGRLDLGGKHG